MKHLMQALLEAQMSLGGVRKDSTNSYANYQYASSESIIAVSRKALLKRGLIAGRKNWEMVDNIVVSTFFVFHPESGEELKTETEFPLSSTTKSPLDKQVAASLTTSLAYWLRDLLMLPRIMHEPDNMDSRNDINTNDDINKILERIE